MAPRRFRSSARRTMLPAYGATFDALNIWDLSVKWTLEPRWLRSTLATQLPTAPVRLDLSRVRRRPATACRSPESWTLQQYLDILSYRQRPTYRLAYRNFRTYESLVTNQSVEATPGVAGARWYEIRRTGQPPRRYVQHSPAGDVRAGRRRPSLDGQHRAWTRKATWLLGYSVVNGVDVFPGIRYTGRLAAIR